ncbi:MAG: sulfatase-like hydrolase/transferase, partial [Halovenus sp.]
MRNIVLVSIDSLRADHCGFMGYGKETTPNLDRLAREGVVFENAIAPGPATAQSMPAIFTGLHPHDHVDSNKFD